MVNSSSWSWQLLRAGSFRLDGGGMFGVVPKTIWSRIAPPDEQNRVALQTNCLLLTDSGGSRKVLIEAGFGDKWTDKERGFYEIERRTVVDALREVGVGPDEIDTVIVTHLHFDHAGGLTRYESGGTGVPPVRRPAGETPGATVPTFPRARVLVQRAEWDDAVANKSTMTRTYLRNHLDPIADRVVLVDGEVALREVAGVRVMPVPGHTWGMQAVCFDDGQGTICFPGDVIPTVNHVGLAFSIGYDMEPYRNMLTKKALLERAVAGGWRLVLDHEPGHAVFHAERDAERAGQFKLIAAT